MRFLILLMLISASVNAGTLTLNGHNCGEVSSATWKPDGTLSLVTDGVCGGVVTPPVEPPPVVVPPSTDCPSGVKCIARPWPRIVQETQSLRAGEVLAIKVQTTAEGVSGRFVTNYTVGDTGSRQVAFSATPGDFSGSAACVKSGLEATSTSWQQGGVGWKCVIPANSPYWINVRFTNCAVGALCRFTLSGG